MTLDSSKHSTLSKYRTLSFIYGVQLRMLLKYIICEQFCHLIFHNNGNSVEYMKTLSSTSNLTVCNLLLQHV
jgi:hypothetical protein